ncbi:MAG TPA: hypothetical protein VGI85_04855 [Chthoniobacterales bacterium]|jgi:hypothetical protein
MFLPPVIELSLFGVADRGQPNRERVILKANTSVNLQYFMLGAGISTDNEFVRPFNNSIYYFDDLVVAAGAWIIVYTGAGQKKISQIPPQNEVAMIYHWGCQTVLFHRHDLVPMLFRVAEVTFERVYPTVLQTLVESNRERAGPADSPGSLPTPPAV